MELSKEAKAVLIDLSETQPPAVITERPDGSFIGERTGVILPSTVQELTTPGYIQSTELAPDSRATKYVLTDSGRERAQMESKAQWLPGPVENSN